MWQRLAARLWRVGATEHDRLAAVARRRNPYSGYGLRRGVAMGSRFRRFCDAYAIQALCQTPVISCCCSFA